MKAKALMLVGAAAGYVLGARAGRHRYEQIASTARRVWNNPSVQEKAGQAQEFAMAKAPEVQETLGQAATKVTSKAKETIGHSESNGSATPGSAGPGSASPGSAGENLNPDTLSQRGGHYG